MRATLRDDLPSAAVSPFQSILNRQLVRRYREALLRLPRPMRRACALRFEHGYSYRRIAELVHCRSSDAARMMVARGRRRLRALLTANTGAEPEGIPGEGAARLHHR